MSRGAVLRELIEEEAAKLIKRHQRYAADLHDEFARRARRTGIVTPKRILSPDYWKVAEGFDPYHVRKKARVIAYTMETSLQKGIYRPRPAVEYPVPKDDGEWRKVSVFQIADNALSRRIFHSLMAKNAPRLSGRCYAYRRDITIHDAVAYVASEFRSGQRLYVAEFDFRRFFESLSHEHFARVLEQDGFLITQRERQVLDAFLRAPAIPIGTYATSASHAADRSRGMPQGTSVSLFLANAAASILDRKLERLGIGFVRYADDTLIWSNDYADVCRAVDALSEAARLMGVELNFDKSAGISILADQNENPEFRSKARVDFLGYAIGRGPISIKPKKIADIKDRISFILYTNLVQAPRKGQIVAGRFAPSFDRDFYVAILQIRRYLYGDLTERRLKTYLARVTPRVRYRGLMSFYPLVDDDQLLKRLDGWLMHAIWCALRKRARLLSAAGHLSLPVPHALAPKALKRLRRGKTSQGVEVDLRIPSFVRMSKLLRKASRAHGPNAVSNATSVNYERAGRMPHKYR